MKGGKSKLDKQAAKIEENPQIIIDMIKDKIKEFEG